MGLERSTRRLYYTADELGRPLNLRSQGGISQKPKPSATVNLVTCISLDERGAAPDSTPDELFLRFDMTGFRRYGPYIFSALMAVCKCVYGKASVTVRGASAT